MGCNCGKGKPPAPIKKPKGSGQQQFQLTTPNGVSTVYGSRLEAEAARVRAGGRGRIATTTF